jgi:hypothetical protein
MGFDESISYSTTNKATHNAKKMAREKTRMEQTPFQGMGRGPSGSDVGLGVGFGVGWLFLRSILFGASGDRQKKYGESKRLTSRVSGKGEIFLKSARVGCGHVASKRANIKVVWCVCRRPWCKLHHTGGNRTKKYHSIFFFFWTELPDISFFLTIFHSFFFEN